jgi:hypothetical protein
MHAGLSADSPTGILNLTPRSSVSAMSMTNSASVPFGAAAASPRGGATASASGGATPVSPASAAASPSAARRAAAAADAAALLLLQKRGAPNAQRPRPGMVGRGAPLIPPRCAPISDAAPGDKVSVPDASASAQLARGLHEPAAVRAELTVLAAQPPVCACGRVR